MAGAPTVAGAPQSQVASLTLKDVLDSKSNSVSKHLGEIADSMCEWEGAVAENLELTPADIANIIIKYPKEMNLQALVTPPCIIIFVIVINFGVVIFTGGKHYRNGSRSWAVKQHMGSWLLHSKKQIIKIMLTRFMRLLVRVMWVCFM